MQKMMHLADFTGERGMEVAAEVTDTIVEMMTDEKNQGMDGSTKGFKILCTCMKNTPAKMMRLFAVLSDSPVEEYTCNAAEAMLNMMAITNDSLVMMLFASLAQQGDAIASASAQENIGE